MERKTKLGLADCWECNTECGREQIDIKAANTGTVRVLSWRCAVRYATRKLTESALGRMRRAGHGRAAAK